jgi:putative sterol carrier protein
MGAREFFEALPGRVDPERIAGVDATYLFEVAGEGRWLVEVRDGSVAVTENPTAGADVTFSLSGETFTKLVAGRQNPMVAYMTGKLKISGDIAVAMHLRDLL